ncbi:TIPIN family protein [Megaselia abdita]
MSIEDITNDILNDNILPGGEEENEDNDNPFGNNENEDGEAIKVEPKKVRKSLNPRPRLTVENLTGKRGIQTIENHYKDIKYKGKGHEKTDLDEVMKRLQHWAHRMYPTYKFEDVLNRVEFLGKKKPLQVHMSKYRMNMLQPDEPIQDADEEPRESQDLDEPFDEFDALLGEQIAMSRLAPKTPGHNKTAMSSVSSINTPKFMGGGGNAYSTPNRTMDDLFNGLAPLPPESSPAPKPKLTSEQMAKIAENRRLAMERLKAKKEAEAAAKSMEVE